ncbi:MAG TPA: ABC transporter ATP-binding protein [Candidatus Saccharimonadia bacterium]|nr:ABC transporter ATP-binding protein [Candidatus Saccharimonadia bacterium]
MKDILRIIRYSWALRRYYIITIIFVVIVSLLNQATPFFLKFVVDALVKVGQGGSVPTSYIWWLVGLILAVNVALTLISNVQGYYGDILGAKLNSLLSQRYYDHILKLPLEYYDNEIAGRITSRLERSISTISQLMNAFANNFVGFFLTSAITLVILAFYAWPVALLLGLLFPFYIWLTTLSSKSWQAKQGPINKNTDINNGRFVESVGQIRVVKSFVQELAESRFFAGKRRDIEAATREQSVEWHWYDVVRRLGLNVVFFGIYAYIIIETFHGRYSLGDLTLLLQLVTQAQFPLFASSFIVDNIQRAQAGSREFFEVMELTPSIADAPDAAELLVTEGKVEFRDATFSYGDGTQVLRGISFTIEPDTKVALVGESGEGKTTISNLLLRFYELGGGQILIDGHDITKVTQASLRQNIGVVFQEPALFSGTVRENIAYSRPNATQAEVEAAATAANAMGFINKLPHGLNTEIGERGIKLSGGQKQRLAIARAILKDAPILILDEATSSLDSKAEHEVQLALNELMKGRTTLIIAHRLSTIAAVNKIVGLRGGRVIEQGTPTELAHAGGIYAELLELQRPTKANQKKLQQYDIATEQVN